jgi:hypothetical protein
LTEVYPSAVIPGDLMSVGGYSRTITHWADGASEFPHRVYVVFLPFYGCIPYLVVVASDTIGVWCRCQWALEAV